MKKKLLVAMTTILMATMFSGCSDVSNVEFQKSEYDAFGNWVDEWFDCSYEEGYYDDNYDVYTVVEEPQEYSESSLIGSTCLGVYSYGNSGENISIACGRCNGVVIPAYGEFNAFNIIGTGSESEGYLSSTGYWGDEVVEVYGGGICAVTTGIYQASLNAGLTILEGGVDHSLGCSYAESGMQSAFAYPDLNLRVYNPYPYPISLWCSYDGNLYVEWWSE